MGYVQPHSKELIDLFTKSRRFNHVFKAGSLVFVAHHLNALTAFCQPEIRKRDHQSALQYDYGLTVLPAPYAEADLINNLKGDRWVSLPRIAPRQHSLADWVKGQFIENDGLSDLVLDDITALLDKYSVDRATALNMIAAQDDKLLVALQRAYEDRFDERIIVPLS